MNAQWSTSALTGSKTKGMHPLVPPGNEPKQTSPGLILSVWTDDNPPNWAILVAENHKRYAERCGYEYKFDRVDRGLLPELTPVAKTWSKVYSLRKALKQDRWRFIFLIDADSIFQDFETSLEDLFKKNKPIVATGDQNDLFNTGHLFLRPNPDTISFVDCWWSLRSYRWPTLPTSHQNQKTGRVNDQVAFNYLVGGGSLSQKGVTGQGLRLFNRTNGFRGNPDRAFKNFQRYFAPTTKWRAFTARFLMARKLRRIIDIVPQQRLNWYPAESGRPDLIYPILHYPGSMKTQLLSDMSRLNL